MSDPFDLPRFQQRRLADWRTDYADGAKFVLVAAEKRGTRYLDATTPEALLSSTLTLFNQRHEGGWYPSGGSEPDAPSLPKAQAEALPPGRIRALALAEWADYAEACSLVREDVRIQAELAAIHESCDAARALLYLLERSELGHQYEEVELEALETG